MESPSVAPRRYRWGKFQGVVLVLLGLAGFLGGSLGGHYDWAVICLELSLIAAGIGLLWKRKFGFFVLAYLSCSCIYHLISYGSHFEAVSILLIFFAVPAIFYYPKRWKEFSRNSRGAIPSEGSSASRLSGAYGVLVARLKSAGTVILGILIILALIAVVGVLFGLTEVLSEYLLPWLLKASEWGFFSLIFVVLPLCLIRRCRPYAAMAILIGSFLFGTTVWMDGLILTVKIWGDGAAVFGLFIAGVGVVPIAMLATLFHGMWLYLAELVALTVLTFGSRAAAIWVGDMSEGRSELIVSDDEDAVSLTVPEHESPYLAAVKLDGKWGFIRMDGSFVAEPKYAWVSPYSDGLAWFSFSDQSERDSLLISWRFDHYLLPADGERFDFPYGLCNYEPRPHEDALGYINHEGHVILAPTFHCAGPFKEGIARVATREKLGIGFINQCGRFEIEPSFEAATDFQDGISIVEVNDRYGLIDRRGRFISEPAFDYLWDFSEGVGRARVGEKYGFVDATGGFVIDPLFDGAWDFKEGLAPVAFGPQWGFINKTGAFCIAPNFFRVSCFSGGVAEVEDWESDSPFYIDKAGNKVDIEAQDDEEPDFSEGLARVCRQNTWGFADSDGRVVIKPRFEAVGKFVNGLASVKSEQGLWGYINRAGDVVIPFQFTDARDFQQIER